MKTIYLNRNTKIRKMSPITFTEEVEYKAYDKSGVGLEEFINAKEYNKLMASMTRALEIKDMDELKNFLKLVLVDANK